MLIRTTLIAMILFARPAADQPQADHFESSVRPLLLAKCASCHGPTKAKGGLRLDSAAGVASGGDGGPVIVPGKPDESRLIQAVRQTGDLKMPPDGKLKDAEIAALAAWVKAGAKWPGEASVAPPGTSAATQPVEPDAPALKAKLQAWYRADQLTLADGKPVHVWPDASGKGRDLAATAGVRKGGVGQPGQFVAEGGIHRRPAVRFSPETGFATSPDLPVDVKGNAAFTIVLVMNLKPTDVPHPHDGILGIGDPANAGDPGQPLAALVQITRRPEPELQLAGGWNHDASLGKNSFAKLWNRPLLLTIVKTPGSMKTTTRFFIDGVPAERQVEGRDGMPDIRHRADIGLYMGKALDWSGSIRGDVSEVIVYNAALGNDDRSAIEAGLAARYDILLPHVLARSKASFTPAQKAFWAFQPVKPVEPPIVKDAPTPVDRFIRAKLDAAGLHPAPPSDKRTLIRRVTFDLTGLPPTPEEVDAFLRDDSPAAYEKVVERLLASPHHGERWARHWLDVVRYAETTANDANAVMRYAWRYRDYVVRSFNADKPYDAFIVEQLAGDLLPADEKAERIIATGFLMVGPKALAETDKEQSRRDIIDDQIDVTGRAFLGLTIACARCHDHKFDPIPTVDYYSMAGILRGTEVFANENRNATMWLERTAGTPAIRVMAPKDLRPTTLPVAIRGSHQSPGALAPRRFLQIVAGEGHAPLTSPQSGRLELARWIASPKNPLAARVMVNRIWQHHFGTGLVATSDNFGSRGESPSHPELLDWLANEFVKSGWSVKAMHRTMVLSAAYRQGSRPDAAAMKADPNNRLLWRMPVRRLEAEEIRDAMLAVSGRLDRTLGGGDSGELLFKEAEDIKAEIRPNRMQSDHPVFTTSVRRSLYLPVVRNAVPDVLALFDGADPNGVTALRNDTTVASQALFLVNHPFVRDQALHLAKRLLADEKATDAARIAHGFRIALSRDPKPGEVKSTETFLAEHAKRSNDRAAAWRSFCQTLLCRNEFLYVN